MVSIVPVRRSAALRCDATAQPRVANTRWRSLAGSAASRGADQRDVWQEWSRDGAGDAAATTMGTSGRIQLLQGRR